MPSSEGFFVNQVKRAEEKLLGTKFCFGCQRHRSLENGKQVVRGKTKSWRCMDCANKIKPVGSFKK
jgi:hypothetical protein